ncbi:MAG: ATP-binding protein [Clostridiales bacterium]|nr:ATP-binding protein [Clostridiales bacterium]
MAEVIILIGRIASGKTHYVKEVKKDRKLMLLSCDDLILTLFDDCLGDKHREIENRCYTFLFGQAEQLIDMGIDVALDFGFWTAQSRANAREYFKERGIKTKAIYFNPPKDVRESRLVKRNKILSNSTRREFIIEPTLLEKLDARFEEPTSEEYDHVIV